MPSSSSASIISKCTIYPSQKSQPNKALAVLKLSVSDIPMLSCQYIQKGVLFSFPPELSDCDHVVSALKRSLSSTLSYFPPLAGRLSTDPHTGHVYISCNDAGAEFVHARAKHLTAAALLNPNADVPDHFKSFFAYEKTLISYSGHSNPLAAVQVTELADGVFVGCTVNHAVTDGTSFWHFFNTFAEITRLLSGAGGGAVKAISKLPDFCRDTVFDSPAVLRFPPGGPRATFAADEPLRERIFHFSREAILGLKSRANKGNKFSAGGNDAVGYKKATNGAKTTEISSFQSLSGHLWRCVTRARALPAGKTTTFRMAVNCRHRVDPKMDPYYFGNAIQSIPTCVHVGELLSRDLEWCGGILHKNVVAHVDATVRAGVAQWEKAPRLFPLGNFDGASITMGSSPRFPMYDNDFGWGRPVAVRSGRANKFDGKISAFPGRDGRGSVDLEVVLAPRTMAALEEDAEFMNYASVVGDISISLNSAVE